MIIEFHRPYGAYAIGDRAGFAPEQAKAIIAKGAARAVHRAVEVSDVVPAEVEAVIPAKRTYRKKAR